MSSTTPAINPGNSSPDTNNVNVLNLSDFQLTPAMMSLLDRGLSFCPSQTEPDHDKIIEGTEKLLRQLRRTTHFSQTENTEFSNPMINLLGSQALDIPSDPVHDTTTFDDRNFHLPSKWDPSCEQYPSLQTFCKSVKMQIYTHSHPRRGYPNISKDERLALKELQNNSEIIIKPADKGGCIVIQNIQDYIREAQRQLSDPKFYRSEPHDLTSKHNDKVIALVEELLHREAISQKVANFLVFDEPRTACIYFLPKIHKNTRPPPGRPIVSANACPTEHISGLVDEFLRPYVPLLPSYIKDTSDFIRKIEELGQLPPNFKMLGLDVSALYTNILNSEALHAAKQTLLRYRNDDLQNLTNNDLVRLLALVLTCNNFEFNGNHYLQTQGVAMGTKVAPTIANLVMGEFERKYVYTYPKQPLKWYRFIDDIFAIWTHGDEALQDFITHLNSVHPTIKFTHEVSDTSLTFLDTKVLREGHTQLYTTLYSKPTDTQQYLHYSSCHPAHQKSGGPYSQLLRIKRICKKDADFQTHAQKLLYSYYKRGYPMKILQEAYAKAQAKSRVELLYTPNRARPEDQESPFFCIVPYNPQNPPIKAIVENNWHLLKTDPKLSTVSKRKVIVGHSRPQNLRDLLVKSRLRYPPPVAPPTPTPTINPDKICNNRNCRYCPRLDTSGLIKSTTTSRTYIVPQKITCRFNNLVYLITCKKCRFQYVGQTKNCLKDRFQQHFLDIRHASNWARAPPSAQAKGPTNVGLHFNRRGHNIHDVQINIIELIKMSPDNPKCQDLRDRREIFWMHKLKTLVPFGINAMDGSNQTRTRLNRPRTSTQ